MLYMGYVGFTIPFAFALGALIMKYPGEKWIHITRRWTMVTWGFLTCGIFLGAHWAYAVLGWGGYWGWDPVENASLMPWLVGTAFLHSVMMQEKRGMLKVWNMWLVFATFWLAILGTFLTRSGIISSVHAFAQSSIGGWFAWFLAISFAVFVFFFVRNKSHLRSENKLESLVSRESSFLFNNLLFLLLTLDVLWGTWFPKISELVQGNKVTVGAPFYNRVAIPVALLLLLLTALGPLLAWRKTSLESLKRNFLWPTVAAFVIALFVMFTPARWGSIFGLKPWHDISYFYSLMTIFLSALVACTVASEFYRGGRVIAEKTGQGNEMAMGYGDKMSIGGYDLICRSYTQEENGNQFTEWALMDVYQNGQLVRTMSPQRIFYKASQQASTKPDIDQGFKEDLYLVYEGQNEKGQPIIKAHVNPMVIWIWIGAWVIIIGTGLALVEPAPAPVTVRVPKMMEHAVATGD
jgi:cytochrome c-type biogenesis protein CcmF